MTFFDDWATYLPDLLRGLRVSLELTLAVLALGLPGGLLLALGASAPQRQVRSLTICLIEIGRGTPAS